MQLRLHDSNNLIDLGFGHWLLPRISNRLLNTCSKYNLNKWDEFLTNSDSFNRLYNKDYKVVDIIIFAAKNLTCKGSDGEIFIGFNDSKFVPGFDRLTLGTFIKTINYGTLEVKCCPIFTDTFNYVSENIDTYVELYYKL